MLAFIVEQLWRKALKKIAARLAVVLTVAVASVGGAAAPAFAAEAYIERPSVFLGAANDPSHGGIFLRSTDRSIVLDEGDYRWTNEWNNPFSYEVSNYRDIHLAAGTYSWNCYTYPRANAGTYNSSCQLIRQSNNAVASTPNLIVEPACDGIYNGECGEWFSWESRLIQQ
ncbi:hypothetical protein [Micromonospora carbonacea]|uniref:hypothetical protein n=1 Tax=Micromonospora carbonacea TaxID=47853 RepID=UPI00114CE944|nr:hypothetical protein [Micromonospora carbonacea]